MKKTIFLATLTAAIFAGCSSDNPMLPVEGGNGNNGGEGNNELISPTVRATVNTPDNAQSPMSGILEVYPCQAGTSIYYGNYVEDVLTPFPGMYTLKDGNTLGNPARAISLPVGTYNMIYWGTPKYEEPIYSNPAVKDPQLTLGGDLSQQYFGLRQNLPDTYGRVKRSDETKSRRFESDCQRQKQRNIKLQHLRHESKYWRYCREIEFVYRRAGQSNQNSHLPFGTFHRWHTDEQCYCHVIPIGYKPSIPTNYYIKERNCKNLQANIERSSEGKYPVHLNINFRRHLLGGGDRKFYDRQLAGRERNNRGAKFELIDEQFSN